MFFFRRMRARRKFGVVLVLMALLPLPTGYRHEYELSVFGPCTYVGPDANGVQDTIQYLLDPFCIGYFILVFLMGVALLIVLLDAF